uniref:Uncharacterized protein n=1 Tax=Rhizophora mucronata TaxID=61149 RepID=A0A2P2IXM1_RHIMU
MCSWRSALLASMEPQRCRSQEAGAFARSPVWVIVLVLACSTMTGVILARICMDLC